MDQPLWKSFLCSSLGVPVPHTPAVHSFSMTLVARALLTQGLSFLSAFYLLFGLSLFGGQCPGWGHLFDPIVHHHDFSLVDRSPAGAQGSSYYLPRVLWTLYCCE